jgi:hypothetical protein
VTRRRTRPRWSYNSASGVVHIRGTDMSADLQAMKIALEQGRIPASPSALAYARRDSNVTVLIAGDRLTEWVIASWFFPLSILYSVPRQAMERRA